MVRVDGGEEGFHKKAGGVGPVAIKDIGIAVACGCVTLMLETYTITDVTEMVRVDEYLADNEAFHPRLYQLNVYALGVVKIGAREEVVLIIEAEVCIAVYVFIRQGIVYGLRASGEGQERYENGKNYEAEVHMVV